MVGTVPSIPPSVALKCSELMVTNREWAQQQNELSLVVPPSTRAIYAFSRQLADGVRPGVSIGAVWIWISAFTCTHLNRPFPGCTRCAQVGYLAQARARADGSDAREPAESECYELTEAR